MRMRIRSDDEQGGATAPRWVGAELVDVARHVGSKDEPQDQVVAFEVALAVRDERGRYPLAALTALLTGLGAEAVAPSYGTLVNTLTAVQYALMLEDEELEGWAPPADALGRIVLKAMAENELMRDQADDLLWALAERRPVGLWLGPRAPEIAANVRDPELRAALTR